MALRPLVKMGPAKEVSTLRLGFEQALNPRLLGQLHPRDVTKHMLGFEPLLREPFIIILTYVILRRMLAEEINRKIRWALPALLTVIL